MRGGRRKEADEGWEIGLERRRGGWQFLVYIVSNVSTLNIYVHQAALEGKEGEGEQGRTLGLPFLCFDSFLNLLIFFWYILSMRYNLT